MSLKRNLYTLLALIALLSVSLTACGGDDDKESTKKFYDGALAVDLPGGWTTEEQTASGGSGQIMLYSSKKIKEAESADDLPDNAAIGTIFISKAYDSELEDGPEGSLRSYLGLEGGLPDDAVFENFEINGNPATRYTGLEEQGGMQGYNYDVGIFFDDTVRVFLLLVGLDGDEGDFKETFDKIANSLTVDVEKYNANLGAE
jgi:hypothetical protein